MIKGIKDAQTGQRLRYDQELRVPIIDNRECEEAELLVTLCDGFYFNQSLHLWLQAAVQ